MVLLALPPIPVRKNRKEIETAFLYCSFPHQAKTELWVSSDLRMRCWKPIIVPMTALTLGSSSARQNVPPAWTGAAKNCKADRCHSLPWFLRSYFVQLLAAAEPQTASPYGKKSTWIAGHAALNAPHPRCGGISAHHTGLPPVRACSLCHISLKHLTAVLLLYFTAGQQNENKLNLNIICSIQTTK